MANTYTQLNIHVVFSVKGRDNIISKTFRDRLHQYLSGLLKNAGQYPLAVNGYKDHVHLFFEMNPKTSISNLISMVKSNSTNWINKNHFVPRKFCWQEGYGGFSYSRSQRNTVINYIAKQELHHRKRSFKDEYLELLEKFGIELTRNIYLIFTTESVALIGLNLTLSGIKSTIPLRGSYGAIHR